MRAFPPFLMLVALAGCVEEEASPGAGGCPMGTFDARVVRVVDGDTLDLECARVRLALVDTVERGEPGYEEATRVARDLCEGERARIDRDELQPLDTTGTRIVAEVTCRGVVLQSRLLDEGHAVVLTDLCDRSEFASAAWARDRCA